VPLDPESTRRRIYDAAVAEVAAHGSAGARVDRIAKNANANKESIYRYYGAKDQLLRRVLEQSLAEKNERNDPKTTAIDDYVAELFRSYIEDPDIIRLLMWEALERGDAPDSDLIEARKRHSQAKLESIVAQQRAGVIDPDLDPRHLLTVLLGMANYWRVLPHMVHAIFGEEPDAETVARHAEFLRECVHRIVTPPPAGSNCGDSAATQPDRVP